MKIVKVIITFILCIVIYNSSYPQTPSLQWIKSFQFSNLNSDQFGSVVKTDANGNIFVGMSASDDTARQRIVLLKYDPNGNLMWEKTFINPSDWNHQFVDLAVDVNGNVYVLGYYFLAQAYNWELIKYNNDGVLQWFKAYVNSPPGPGQPVKIQLDHNGNPVITGTTVVQGEDVEISTIKYDPDGNLLWTETITPPQLSTQTTPNDLKIDSQNNIILGATVLREFYAGRYEFNSHLYKYNPDGQLLWQKVFIVDTLNVIENNYTCSSVNVDDSDNVYFITTSTPYLETSIFTQKYNPSGQMVWQQVYSYNGQDDASCSTFSNGNIVTIGRSNDTTHSYPLTYDLVTIKSNSWTQRWNIDYYRVVNPYAATSDASGNVYVTGEVQMDSAFTDEDMFIVKFDHITGDTTWSYYYTSQPGANDDVSYSITTDNSNNLIATGYTYYYSAYEPVVTMKFSLGPAGVKNNGSNILKSYKLYQNYPNPFNPSTTVNYTLPKASNVKIDIFNVLGEKVATLVNSFKQAGNYKVNWNAEKFASGVYFYRMQADGYVQTKKMLFLK